MCAATAIVFLIPFLINAQKMYSGRVASMTDQTPVAGASVVLKGATAGCNSERWDFFYSGNAGRPTFYFGYWYTVEGL